MLDHEPGKECYEGTETSMTSDDLHRCLDLRRAELDLELMACALAVQRIRILIAALANGAGRLDEGEALSTPPGWLFCSRG